MTEHRSLRLLMIVDPYVPAIGGLERHVHELSRELVRRGHRVTVATTSHPSAPAYEAQDGVHVHRIGGLSRILASAYADERRFHPTLPDPGMMVALRRLVIAERPDIVHAHSWIVFSFLPLKAWSGARLVVTVHDYSLICPKKTYLRAGRPCEGPAYRKCVGCATAQYGTTKSLALTTGLRLSSRMYPRVDRYVAVSRSVGEEVGAVIGDATPMEVVPSFIRDDAAEIASRAPRPDFLPPGDYVLFVGALGRHKGLDVLLEAWSGLTAPPQLVLIGGRRDDTPERFPDGVTVVYDVPHEATMAAWAHCLLGVVPSLSEGGGPMVLIEAMACGRAVVASAVGGAPDTIVDGQSGVLVPPNDPHVLRHAVQSLLDDPERRQRLGDAARLRARGFTLSAGVDHVERLYLETLQEGSARG
jgi:glycosyltransferase involved in cell wall biosynthesis